MANQTTRFEFNTFGGDVAGSILDDSGKFTGLDRDLMDLLFAAIEQHNHRYAPDAAAGPSDAPTATISATGGLSAGLDYSYVVSFISDDGLETPAGDEVTETTPDILPAPGAVSGETATGGNLAVGAYDYALTGTRGDEQSPLGDLFSVTVVAGEGTVNLTIPALGDNTSYTVWRRKDTEGGFTNIGTTTSTSVADTGAVSAYPFPTDPTYAPPTSNAGVDQYAFTITLSAADQDLVQNYAGWRLYRTTTSGIYSAQSLVAEVVDREVELDPGSDLVVEYVDFGDALITGQPNTVDQRMNFQPFVFEESVSLAAASGDYPANYPIVVGNQLYLSDGAGDWVGLTAASGGSDGQILTRVSGAPQWAAVPHELPNAGTTGQVLAKNSGTDYDVEWVDVSAPSGGGGGTSTTFVEDAGPFVAVNPTPEIVQSISVPAGKSLNFTWHFNFQVTDAGSFATVSVAGTGLLSFGSTIFTTMTGSQANPTPSLVTASSVIDLNTPQGCIIQGAAHNPTGSPSDCEFKIEEINGIGSSDLSDSTLFYWVS